MNKEIVIYVDIDDTIVRSVGSKRIPIPNVIRHVRDLKNQGAILFCWSSGGADYAKSSAQEFGIADCFKAFLPKPHIVIDDQRIMDWRQFLHVYPVSCSDRTLNDYCLDLEK